MSERLKKKKSLTKSIVAGRGMSLEKSKSIYVTKENGL